MVLLENYLDKLKLLSIFILTACSFFNIIRLRTNYKKFLILISMVILGFVFYFISSDFLILQLLLVIISSLNIKFEEVVKSDFIIKLIIFIGLVSLSLAGQTNELVIHRTNGLLRRSFGFYHPNTFSLFVFMMYLEYIYINRKKITVKKLLLGIFTAIIVTELSDSRTSNLALILFIVCIFLKKHWTNIVNNKTVGIFSRNMYIIFTCVSLLLTIMYINNNSLAYILDEMFSGRLMIQSVFLQNYNISLLGINMTFFFSLDNAYIRIILNFGICGALLYNYIFSKIMLVSQKDKDDIIFIIFVILGLYGFMENIMFNVVYNIFWLYFVKYIVKKVNVQNESICNSTNI